MKIILIVTVALIALTLQTCSALPSPPIKSPGDHDSKSINLPNEIQQSIQYIIDETLKTAQRSKDETIEVLNEISQNFVKLHDNSNNLLDHSFESTRNIALDSNADDCITERLDELKNITAFGRFAIKQCFENGQHKLHSIKQKIEKQIKRIDHLIHEIHQIINECRGSENTVETLRCIISNLHLIAEKVNLIVINAKEARAIAMAEWEIIRDETHECIRNVIVETHDKLQPILSEIHDCIENSENSGDLENTTEDGDVTGNNENPDYNEYATTENSEDNGNAENDENSENNENSENSENEESFGVDE